MDAQPEPLLKYAEELLHSYSRLIVYSGDILSSLPEPREGLGVANIKPKKDESTAFLREWQHLESVFDEYLIRLNDIRTRAHEELEAARIKCLAGEDIDLTLPEAVVKLSARLEKYKRQYDTLQSIISGSSTMNGLEAAEQKGLQEKLPSPNGKMEMDTSKDLNEEPLPGGSALPISAVEANSLAVETIKKEVASDIEVDTPPAVVGTVSVVAVAASNLNSGTPDLNRVSIIDIDDSMNDDAFTPMSAQSTNDNPINTQEIADAMEVANSATSDDEPIDVDEEFEGTEDNNGESQTIDLDSNSDDAHVEVDDEDDDDVDDEDMEDIFQ
ncbi:hypothetical protein J3B02_002097 [Coemansia erecta]|uniref:Uncharacterized protein n=1 Tax=Coemansia asiatica TaxID=1052880 RepID=A0A9W8CLK7_9FUNG|nr:hypothetical protein LPJ64_001810 [Coemansia asiatica]KAJ2855570.1 hypothetical protein J3B02_002097 [Coemansia erecta]KAJ2888739.1 hypothetical protein FB639_000432 [Coemansia asiatica]